MFKKKCLDKRNWESSECVDNFPNYRHCSSLPYMCLTYHKYRLQWKNTNLKSKDCYYTDQSQQMQKQEKKKIEQKNPCYYHLSRGRNYQ